jgi:hypothetical protein
MMAQVMAPAARAAASQFAAGRHTASGSRSAQPQRLIIRNASGGSFGGNRFQQSPRFRRARTQSCRPQGFCGPQFNMGGPGFGGFGMGVSPADLQNMMKVHFSSPLLVLPWSARCIMFVCGPIQPATACGLQSLHCCRACCPSVPGLGR